MKKITKVCLIIAGALASAGCILCLVSLILRGPDKRAYEYNEYDEYVAERIERTGEILESAGVRTLGKMLKNAGEHSDRLSTVEEHSDHHSDAVEENDGAAGKEIDAGEVSAASGETAAGKEAHLEVGEVENLSLSLGAGSFIIQEKDASDGVVDIYIQGTDRCDYRIKGHTLYVEGFKGVHVLNNRIRDNIITMKIPGGMSFHEVDLEVGAGAMELSFLQAREISAVIGAGTITMGRVQADELEAEIGAGEMTVTEAEVEKADLEVNLGACCFTGAINRELDAECNMGSLVFILEGSEQDHNYEIECSAGTIDLNGFEYTALGSEKTIHNGAGSDFELCCNMGEIIIQFEE